MEMNNLNKLDYAMEETLAKFTRNNEGEQYKKMFIEQFCRSGYSQTLFTRDNNADVTADCDYESVAKICKQS